MSLYEKIASVGDALTVIYLGQAGFLLSRGGESILVDPYLSYSVDRCTEKGDGRWTRSYAPPFSPEELDFIDYVFISHDHLDHADPETVSAIARASGARFVCGGAIADKVRSYGAGEVLCPREGEETAFGRFSARLIPAAHEEIHRNALGEAEECGFILDFGGIRVYHAGDSLVYEGLSQAVAGVDLMLLPVNGYGYYRRFRDNCIGNMDAYDAARLAREAGAGLMIPMHYDLYPGNSVPEVAVESVIRASAPELEMRLPRPGRGWVLTKLGDGLSVSEF